MQPRSFLPAELRGRGRRSPPVRLLPCATWRFRRRTRGGFEQQELSHESRAFLTFYMPWRMFNLDFTNLNIARSGYTLDSRLLITMEPEKTQQTR